MNYEKLLGRKPVHYLRHARDWFRYAVQWPRRLTLDLPRLREELTPVFVIGANRSGTSVLAYLLSQHPDLEGLFSQDVEPHYSESGHSIGFCESMHIWSHLMPNPGARLLGGHLPFWGLPAYMGQTYRDCAHGDRERRRLAWDVARYRTTKKTPLLKNNLNSLRVGLIADVFPRARFVLICRSWQDFTARSIHKWATDRSVTVAFDRPLAGFHWHMVNLVARYDLEIYAPGRYAIVWLDALTAGPVPARESLAKLTAGLSLTPHEFDLAALAGHWKQGSATSFSQSPGFADVATIVESERQLLAGIHSRFGKA